MVPLARDRYTIYTWHATLARFFVLSKILEQQEPEWSLVCGYGQSQMGRTQRIHEIPSLSLPSLLPLRKRKWKRDHAREAPDKELPW